MRPIKKAKKRLIRLHLSALILHSGHFPRKKVINPLLLVRHIQPSIRQISRIGDGRRKQHIFTAEHFIQRIHRQTARVDQLVQEFIALFGIGLVVEVARAINPLRPIHSVRKVNCTLPRAAFGQRVEILRLEIVAAVAPRNRVRIQ